MRSQKSREVAWTGMLFALAIALSFLESAITPLLGLMPAMKLGLSNLVVMYALLFLNTRTAAELVLLKALFALLTRGPTAGFLSLCGCPSLYCGGCCTCPPCRESSSSRSAVRWPIISANCWEPRYCCPVRWH